MPFILTQFSSIPSLLRSFNHGWMLNFVKKVLRSFWNQCSRPCDIFPQLFSLCSICLFSIVVIQLLSRIRLSVTPWTAAHQASLSSTISRSWLKLMSLSQWCPPYLLGLFHFKHFRVPFAYGFNFFAEITHLILVYCTPFQLESLTY